MTIPLRLSRGNFSTVCSSGDAEIKEVLLQRLDWRSKHVVAMEDVAHLFAQPKEFPESAGCSPPRVLDRKIQKLKHSLKCLFEAFAVSALERSCCAFELASDIAQLFED